jgi:hypothetical protein
MDRPAGEQSSRKEVASSPAQGYVANRDVPTNRPGAPRVHLAESGDASVLTPCADADGAGQAQGYSESRLRLSSAPLVRPRAPELLGTRSDNIGMRLR